VAVISNPSDAQEIRVLVRYEIPEFLTSADILYAQLTGSADAAVIEGEGAVELEVLPVAKQWSPGSVSWTSPWTQPGGDLDGGFQRSFLVRQGSQPIRIDVTELVTEWATGERANTGLMLRASSFFGGTFSLPAQSGGGPGVVEAPVIKVIFLPTRQ
jgi:hypothetical protein